MQAEGQAVKFFITMDSRYEKKLPEKWVKSSRKFSISKIADQNPIQQHDSDHLDLSVILVQSPILSNYDL